MRQAFTLFELLVTITIIACLMALLLPTIQMVRESAWQVVCLGKLRQNGVAILNYSGENRGQLPPARVWRQLPITSYYVDWFSPQLVGDYLMRNLSNRLDDADNRRLGAAELRNIEWCPRTRRKQWDASAGGMYGSYGLNSAICPVVWSPDVSLVSPQWSEIVRMARLNRPGERVLAADGCDPVMSAGGPAFGRQLDPDDPAYNAAVDWFTPGKSWDDEDVVTGGLNNGYGSAWPVADPRDRAFTPPNGADPYWNENMQEAPACRHRRSRITSDGVSYARGNTCLLFIDVSVRASADTYREQNLDHSIRFNRGYR